jgi:hypothetical protein
MRSVALVYEDKGSTTVSSPPRDPIRTPARSLIASRARRARQPAERSGVPIESLVELRGFEPLTSAVRLQFPWLDDVCDDLLAIDKSLSFHG